MCVERYKEDSLTLEGLRLSVVVRLRGENGSLNKQVVCTSIPQELSTFLNEQGWVVNGYHNMELGYFSIYYTFLY